MKILTHQFVEKIPSKIDDGVIYVSIHFETVIHKCCCGCGMEVVTPLSPTGWSLTFNGESVSLYPSIGNWSFPCRSHYWITENEVVWSTKWNADKIDDARKKDLRDQIEFFQKLKRKVDKDQSNDRFPSKDKRSDLTS